MKCKALFLCVFLIVSLVLPLYQIQEVKAQESYYWLDVNVDRDYYFVGDVANITVSSNSSVVQLQIQNASEHMVFDETISANTTASFVVDDGYGKYTVKGYVGNSTVTTWFWLQKADDLIPISVPYSWNWKGINYTLLNNYTLSVKGFDGSFNVDWLSEIFTKFKPTVTVYRNDYLIFIKTWGKDIDCDHWLMLQHKGLKIRLNGTVASPTTLKWNFKNTANLELAWILSGLKIGHLIYDWSDFDRTGVAYEWDKTALKCNVYLDPSFDVDPYIFEDGFESNNFDAWDGTTTGAGCTAEVLALDPKEGSKHAHFETDVDGNKAYVTFTDGDTLSESTLFQRIYFKVKSFPSSDGTTNIFVFIGSNTICIVRLKKVGADWKLNLRGRDGASWSEVTGSSVIVVDTYYCLEMKVIVAGSGEYRVYLDGSEECVLTGKDSDDYGNVVETRTGITYLTQAESIYVDSCVVDSSYIGPISEGEAYVSDLSQSLSTTWSVLTEWNAILDFTQSLSTSWTVLTQTTFNIITSLSNTFTWAIDIIHTVGGIAYIADLSQAISTSWTILTQWNAITDLSQSLSTTWTVLIQSSFNIVTSLSNTFTWTVDILKGVITDHIVDLTLTVVTSWIIDVARTPWTTIYATKGFVLATIMLLLLIGLPIMALIWRRKE